MTNDVWNAYQSLITLAALYLSFALYLGGRVIINRICGDK